MFRHTRKIGQAVYLDNSYRVTILSIDGDEVSLKLETVEEISKRRPKKIPRG